MDDQNSQNDPRRLQGEFQPGQTISPSTAVPASAPASPAYQPAEPRPLTEPAHSSDPSLSPMPVIPTELPPQSAAPAAPASSSGIVLPVQPGYWPAPPDQAAPHPIDPQMKDTSQGVSWTASEFIAHHKSFGWYLGLAGAAVVLAAVVFWLTKDMISTGVVVLGAVVLGGYGARQPRQLRYHLDDSGLSVGVKQYPYQQFRSFAVVDEGAFSSIMFMPLKRFAPAISVYYDPADEQRVIDVLADRLPMEEHKRDLVDSFMHRIRF